MLGGSCTLRKYSEDVMDKDFFLAVEVHLLVICCTTGTVVTTGGAASVVPDMLCNELIVESNHPVTFSFADALSIE
jgi:hypothetical protein